LHLQTCDFSTFKLMVRGLLNVPYFMWTVVAHIVAGIFVYMWPHGALPAPSAGFRYFILRWGHALTWLLLAVSFFLRGLSPSLNGVANIIALVGGFVYLLFMVMTFVIK
jgi:hypothetical protein